MLVLASTFLHEWYIVITEMLENAGEKGGTKQTESDSTIQRKLM